MSASIGSTNETFNRSYSNDFDSSEASTFLGCFKLPVPPAVKQSHVQLYESCRQAKNPSEGFLDWNTRIMPRSLLSKSSNFFWKKVVGGQSPVNDRRVGGKHNIVKQADSGLGGWMLRNFQGESLKPITSLRFVRLPSAWPCHGWDSSCWLPAACFSFPVYTLIISIFVN